MKFDTAVSLLSESKRYKKWLKSEQQKNDHFGNLLRKQGAELDALSQQKLEHLRRSLRLANQKDIQQSTEDSGENFKNAVNSFFHINIGKNTNATDEDIKEFKDFITNKDGKIPKRLQYLMTASLSKSTFRQRDAENNISQQADAASKNLPPEVKTPGGSGVKKDAFSLVNNENFNIIQKWLADNKQPPLPPSTGNAIVPNRLVAKANAKSLPETKRSDYWFEDDINGKIMVTFKSVDNSGGSQKNQINDVAGTTQALSTNFLEKNRPGKTANKTIAVIRGAEAMKYFKHLENNKVSWCGKVYEPIAIYNSQNKRISIPRVMTEGEFLKAIQYVGYFLKATGNV